MNIGAGERILDCACGQGFFARAFFKKGANVTGIDASKKLISIAKKESPLGIKFLAADAERLSCFSENTFDKVAIILAAQNIKNLDNVFRECKRILTSNGKLYLVINHPSFRVPKSSDWFYEENKKIQYRRVGQYLSISKVGIEMNPGKKTGVPCMITFSFHRPLQYFFKALRNSGFLISNLREWISHKKSNAGPRQSAEDRARKEIPLFMMIEAVIIKPSQHFLSKSPKL